MTNHSPMSETATADLEKQPPSPDLAPVRTIEDLDALGEREGYVLDASLAHAQTRDLKTTEDGKTILIPQPSADPNDPLNWSSAKKWGVLAVVSCTCE